ncbi:MAG: hypothetical protein RLZZ387_1101 [Chloroflexota bacterium]
MTTCTSHSGRARAARGPYVTVLYAVLHLAPGTVQTERAGHERPLLWHSGMGAEVMPSALGHPLGLLSDPAIDTQRILLAPGESLLLFTDDVTEATNAAGEFFGGERLRAVVATPDGGSAQALCDHTVMALEAFRGAAPQADDITLLALRAR